MCLCTHSPSIERHLRNLSGLISIHHPFKKELFWKISHCKFFFPKIHVAEFFSIIWSVRFSFYVFIFICSVYMCVRAVTLPFYLVVSLFIGIFLYVLHSVWLMGFLCRFWALPVTFILSCPYLRNGIFFTIICIYMCTYIICIYLCVCVSVHMPFCIPPDARQTHIWLLSVRE